MLHVKCTYGDIYINTVCLETIQILRAICKTLKDHFMVNQDFKAEVFASCLAGLIQAQNHMVKQFWEYLDSQHSGRTGHCLIMGLLRHLTEPRVLEWCFNVLGLKRSYEPITSINIGADTGLKHWTGFSLGCHLSIQYTDVSYAIKISSDQVHDQRT